MPDRPRCPKCDARLILTRVQPISDVVGMHYLECPRCDFKCQIATLEKARPSGGWVIQSEAMPARHGAEAMPLLPPGSWLDHLPEAHDVARKVAPAGDGPAPLRGLAESPSEQMQRAPDSAPPSPRPRFRRS